MNNAHLGTDANSHAILLTVSQRQVLRMAAQATPGATLAWNEVRVVRLEGALLLPPMERAVCAVIGKHDALRLVVRDFALIDAPNRPTLEIEDLRGDGGEVRADAVIDALLQEPFDLDRGPLFRTLLLRVSEELNFLVLAGHHLVVDGWSFGVLLEDLATTYNAECKAGGQSEAMELTPSFIAYLSSQRSVDAVQAYQADLAYWEGIFADAWPTLDLPTDRARRTPRDVAAARADLDIDRELLSGLKHAAGKSGVSLSSAMCGVFAGLIARLAGTTEVVVAVPVAAQTGEGLDRLVGHCMSHLPVRIGVDVDAPARELLVHAQQRILDAYDHMSVGLEELVERYASDTEPTRLPLARVKFNFNPSLENPQTEFAGLRRSISTPPRKAEQFELFLNVEQNADGATLACQFNTDLFDAVTVSRWLALYRQALLRLIEDAGNSAAKLFAPPSDELALLQRFNGEVVPFDRQLRIEQRIDAQVQRSPDAIAVCVDNRSLSYRELQRRANGVAAELVRAGVRPGDLVGLACGRNEWMLVGLYGIMKAGAGYVPLDPGFPVDRLDFMVEDSAVRLVLNDASVADAWQPLGARTLAIDALTPSDSAPAVSGSNSEMPAYVIFTSGSTGKPKGVRVPHRSVINLLDSVSVEPGMSAADVVLAVTTLSFDIAVSEVILPLTVGARIVMAERHETADGLRLRRLVESQRVNFIDATPATWRLLLAAGWAGDRNLKAICTGEPLPPDLAVVLLDRVGELWNGYGPTETTVWSSFYHVTSPTVPIPIGKPVRNTQFHVLDARLRPLPVGAIGELWIGGDGVTLGYLNRPDLTEERFIPDPFGPAGARMYKTGDLGRWRNDGVLECLGRSDHQVKVRGYRIELGEIEVQLGTHPGVARAVVVTREDRPGDVRLVAYLIAKGELPDISSLRSHLLGKLPEYMVPQHYVPMQEIPLLPNGKINRHALPRPATQRPDLGVPYRAPATPNERVACDAFGAVLGLDDIGCDDNFFELGGNSLLAMQVLLRLEQASGCELSAPTIFAHPTPAGLAGQIGRDEEESDASDVLAQPQRSEFSHEPIAVIGMAGRFPGAATVEQLWDNLLAGRDSITDFTLETLDASVPQALRADPSYVRARGIIDGIEDFDAAFFGMSVREAEIIDPQHRVFLEIAWECLERAGHAPDRTSKPVGVFAGVYTPSYLHRHISAHPDAVERLGDFQVMVGNDKDYVATRVAYKLSLKGPAIAVHTACSTSLVAIAQAVDSLRLGRCAMALAGGASVSAPPRSGYLYQEGAMLSADARTRTFDAGADGTAFNDGAAVVLLKRLTDAIADGDMIHAVIRGVATNNDGGGKASFTAPSVDGQMAVIAAAHADAGVEARSIGYIEAHGTATPLGDPVEIEGLTRAFRRSTRDTGFCRIGSVKSNIGHLITAAGATGVIKAAMSLATERIPATIHYSKPNPKIDFARSPFVVNDQLTTWPRGDQARRAGVSSFGVGGTNAHVVLEEAPLQAPSSAAVGPQLLLLSARTRAALDSQRNLLAQHLQSHADLNLADVAHTLDVGRSRYSHRACIVASTTAEAAATLAATDAPLAARRELGPRQAEPVWMFPGQGAQYAGMGSGLYEADAVFRDAIDACLAALQGTLDFDLRASMFNGGADALMRTEVTQPATFCLEYALARMWLARGAKPVALVGHSVGEFVAAVLAGVMPLADAVRLVARRGALMQALPGGSMLSVRMAADKLLPLLPIGVALAAENGPTACVVAGETGPVQAFQQQLEAQGVVARMLQTSHAFHSAMMDPAVPPFEALVRQVKLAAPQLPIVSTLTGEWLSAEQATDPRYWARHLREPVRFSPALRCAQARHPAAVFHEIGPRGTLSTLARQHSGAHGAPLAVASLGDTPQVEVASVLLAQGQLWTVGVTLDAPVAQPSTGRHRVILPTYPFERKRCWLEPLPATAQAVVAIVAAAPQVVIPATAQPASPVAELLRTAVSSTSIAMTTAPAIADRRPRLVARLRELFEDVAGVDLQTSDASTSFVELGLDSLTLTQAALALKKAFAVSVTFRQLMEKFRNFETLSEHLDQVLPADPVAATPAPVADVAAVAVAPASVPVMVSAPVQMVVDAGGSGRGDLLQQVIQQQMQLMSQQLAALTGAAFAAPSAAPAVAQAAAVATPAQQAAPATQLAAAAQPAAAAVPVQTDEDTGVKRYDVKKAFGAIARIHTTGGALTERQRVRLESFVRRYVERTRKSKQYTEQHRSHLADPRVVNGFRPTTKEIVYQVVVDRTKGSHMWDLDGNEYVDALNGFGMSMFGWQPDFVMDAVRKQIDLGYEIGPMHPLSGEVAKLVCDLTGFDRAGLCNTGSEAVMAAIRIARTVTGRSRIISFAGSYHGTFDEVLVRAGRGGKGISAAPGIMSCMFGEIHVLEYGTPETLEYIRANAHDLAAVLVEPVQSRRPDFQPREFLKEVRAITEQNGTCLIFDEVITGFRSHPGGAQALFGIRADLASYGKVIGGGFPVGVIAGKREFMDALDGGAWQYGDDSMPTVGVTYFAGTFVRHPLALAAAKASLVHLKEQGPDLQLQLNLSTAAMADEMNAHCREVGAPLAIRHFSSLWRVSWLEDHPLQDLLFAMMRSRGVHILDNFPCFLTTAHTPEDIATIKTAFKESIAEMQEAEFLPRRVDAPVLADASRPPVPNARLGRDKDGRPAWFIPDPQAQGKFIKVNV